MHKIFVNSLILLSSIKNCKIVKRLSANWFYNKMTILYYGWFGFLGDKFGATTIRPLLPNNLRIQDFDREGLVGFWIQVFTPWESHSTSTTNCSLLLPVP